jgi:hypothetical protein
MERHRETMLRAVVETLQDKELQGSQEIVARTPGIARIGEHG